MPSPPAPSTTPPVICTAPPAAPTQTENEDIDASENTICSTISVRPRPRRTTQIREYHRTRASTLTAREQSQIACCAVGGRPQQ
eukprot:4385664-Pleurochrysis_carterae.AAC.2